MGRDLGILLRLLRLLRPQRGWLLLGALLSTLTVLASVGLMAIAGAFIASMALAGASATLVNYFLPAAGIRLLAILRTGGRYAERVVTHEATFRVLAELRVWVFERLVPLAPARLAHERSADLAARVQGDVDTLQHAYLGLYAPLVTALVCTLVTVGLFALRSAAAALVLLVLLTAAWLGVPLAIRRMSAAAGKMIVDASAALRVQVVDALQGMGDLAVYGASERVARDVARLAGQLGEAQRRAGFAGLVADGNVALSAGLALWLVTIVAIAAADGGAIDRSEVPMLAMAALAAFEAAAPLPLAMQRAGEVVAAGQRILSLADAAPALRDPAAPSPVPLDAGITMRGVTLRYPGALDDVLHGVDLDVASGQHIALVGPSGAGKSSIAALLARFFEYGGAISVGGHDLRAYHGDDLRRLIAVATQQAHLLNASLRENLRLAAPQATDAQMLEALAVTQALDIVDGAPQGLDLPLGEGGVRLSAGQARRVVLARALLRDASIVVLDEPTAGLDPGIARALLQALRTRLAGRTLIVITHDVAQVEDWVDAIVVLQAGRITGRYPSRAG